MKKLITGLLSLTLLAGCASVKPDFSVSGDETVTMRTDRVMFDPDCDTGTDFSFQDRTYYTDPDDQQLFDILLGAVVTAGVDFVGNQIKSAADEKTRTASAILNVDNTNQKVGCLNFYRYRGATAPTGDKPDYDFFFQIYLKPAAEFSAVEPILTEFQYRRSIDGKTDGVRGLTVGLQFSRPGSTAAESQTFKIGNVELGATRSWGLANCTSLTDTPDMCSKDAEYRFIAPYMSNPFRRIPAAPKKGEPAYRVGTPFTVSVTLTEVRNADKLLGFASDTVAAANDDLTAELISILGLSDDEDDEGDGDGDGDGTPPPDGAVATPPSQ